MEDDAVKDAVAKYVVIVGIAQGVGIDLKIAHSLGITCEKESVRVNADTINQVGESNDVSAKFKTDSRDPWITESIAHLFALHSGYFPDLIPFGAIAALTPIHIDAKDHGLDLLAIHVGEPDILLSIGESKASEKNASNHVGDAARLFREIDDGLRDSEIRQKVNVLSHCLSKNHQDSLALAFWKDERVYLALVGYCVNSAFSPSAARPTLGALGPGKERVRLVAISLQNYKGYFDQMAEKIRQQSLLLFPLEAKLV
jgi:hypothetical protein